jgi:hypothetical protein
MPKKKTVKPALNVFLNYLVSEYKNADTACIKDPAEHPERLFLAVKNSNSRFLNTKLPHNTVETCKKLVRQHALDFCKDYLDRSKMKNYDVVFPKIDAIFESMKQDRALYGRQKPKK